MIDTKLKSSKGTCGEVKPDDRFGELSDSTGIEKTEREAEQVDQMEFHSTQERLVSKPHAHRVWANHWVWPVVMIVLGECVPRVSQVTPLVLAGCPWKSSANNCGYPTNLSGRLLEANR